MFIPVLGVFSGAYFLHEALYWQDWAAIVLIVLGSVAGVSIAGLFESGFFVAMVLLLALLVLARWKARKEETGSIRRPSAKVIGRLALIATPALVLPFLIRSAVGGGVATATLFLQPS
jgi:TRAP-type C4-dicarboxylate transport system permease large subunit